MRVTAFQSRALPPGLAEAVRARLEAAHLVEPFSPVDLRGTVRRAAAVLAGVGLESSVYRGGLDLRGVEVDHVWLAALPDHDGHRDDGEPYVLDAAFPLFDGDFVEVLRRFVSGDTSRAELAAAASGSALDDRVLGLVPNPMRYLGAPVWSAR